MDYIKYEREIGKMTDLYQLISRVVSHSLAGLETAPFGSLGL